MRISRYYRKLLYFHTLGKLSSLMVSKQESIFFHVHDEDHEHNQHKDTTEEIVRCTERRVLDPYTSFRKKIIYKLFEDSSQLKTM